ncbi:MAG TPA: flagellar motor protein MotB [Burkholderiaceae bacterium]
MLEAKAGKPDRHEATVIKRGSRKHHDEGHGGAWKVAFADFCLALLSLFLVLWLMAAREQEHLKEVMREPGGNAVDEGQGHMTETMGGPRGSLIEREPLPHTGDAPAGSRPAEAGAKVHYESPADLKTLSQVLEKLSVDAGLSSNLQTVITAYGLRVMLHDTDKQGMFERGSAAPNERFRNLLRKMGPLFAQMSNQMLIVGHTDSLQYADRGYAAFSNWSLSSDRAMAARANLVVGGMPMSSVLQVVGMADRAPMDAVDATAGVNRRIELLILTTAQAHTVAAMFGMPDNTQPLTDGVDSALPDREALQALRAQIIQTKGSTPDAN